MLEGSVRDDIAEILLEQDLERKLEKAARLTRDRQRLAARLDSGDRLPSLRPGRPESWTVASQDDVPRRPRLGQARGRYLLMHSVAHIELSAIELALMACSDFPDQEVGYYRAMLLVAEEEVRHTRMVMRRLREMGGVFGSDPVHLGLWESAVAFDEVLDRLAVVPRVLEARGLDVSPGLRAALVKAGDPESAAVLEVIYRDEIRHVAIGTHWYRRVALGRGLDPARHWLEIADRFRPGRPGPLDREGRERAGFTPRELDFLAAPRG